MSRGVAGFVKRPGRSLSGLPVLLIAAACAWPVGASGQAICGARPERPASSARGTDFVRTDLMPREYTATDSAGALSLVSLDGDVLWPSEAAARGGVSASLPSLHVRSVLCVRHKPEMLGLVLQNAGPARPEGWVRVEVSHDGTVVVLFGRLPGMDAGEAKPILLSSSIHLGGAQGVAIQAASHLP